MKITLHATINDSISLYFARTPENLFNLLCVIPLGSPVTERSFSCIRQMHNWFSNGMVADLLSKLGIIAMHCHIILVLKTYIYTVYVNRAVSLRRTDNYSVISFFLLFLFI